jgi:hypothetical protein
MRTWIGTTAVAALVSAGLAVSPEGARAADNGTVSLTKLVRHPESYFGKVVTVKSEVGDLLDANVFTLDQDIPLAGPDVLVLVPKGLAGTLTREQKVTVTGEVRPYVEADLERDFAFFKHGKLVDVQKKVDWKTRPVIVARSVKTDTGRELTKE